MSLQSHHINQYCQLTATHSKTLSDIQKLKKHNENEAALIAQRLQMKARMNKFYENRAKL